MSPGQHYSQLLADRQAALDALERVHARLGSIRLAIGASFLIIAWACVGPRALSAEWLIAPILAFAAVLFMHQRVRARRDLAQRAARFFAAGIERIEDRWSGKGTSGARFSRPHHPYADDLDVFGSGSLYELLCAARTPLGENTLAHWLDAPADLTDIRARQAGSAELSGRMSLREALATDGPSAKIELHAARLTEWGAAANRLGASWIGAAAWLAVAMTAGAAVLAAATGILSPLLALIVIEVAIGYLLRKPVHAALTAVEGAYADLKGVSMLLRRIEMESFESPPLVALQQRLVAGGAGAGAGAGGSMSASAALSKLATLVSFVEARRNPLLAPFMVLLLYPLHTALAVERWRTAHGAAMTEWLEALGEMEALLSLAQYAFEHPDDPYPQFVGGAACFQAVELGHPLIPAVRRICNDIDIAMPRRVLLVSGSNMSGKSTLLRTVGINTVLAMCGAPVRARWLRLTPLQPGASIRINDSLHAGSSRFYAEITRLRQLFEPATLPLLFLLDELLQGTNSADRKIGAQGVIRALLARGAIGLISTHDLALTELAGIGAAEGVIENVHFQDELLEGKLEFDFKLRPGVVAKSNGIELMRSIGLDV